MSNFDDIEPIGRVTADDRRRVPLGQADVLPGARYTLFQGPDGVIVLRPSRQKETNR